MKNWKKLISGVVAMMAVATAVGATPQKVPVEVLDVADATDILVETVVNEDVQTAIDEGGYWTFTTGSGTARPGSVTSTGSNQINLNRHTNIQVREVSVGYTTNSAYTYADTKVQFSYTCNTIDAFKGHLIQVSSDALSSVAVTDEVKGVADGLSYAEFYTDSAVIVVKNGQVKYFDPTDNTLKDSGFTVEEDVSYSFRFERTAGGDTYDLYIDTVKIGVNSTPVLENIPLLDPTGKNFNRVRAWLGSSADPENAELARNYSVYLSDISFMQSVSDVQMKEEFVSETFDTLPADGWSYYDAGGYGTVTAAGDLYLAYQTSSTRTRNVNAWYKNEMLKALDEYEISFDFTPSYTAADYVESFGFVPNGEVYGEAENTPAGLSPYKNSVHVILSEEKFLLGVTDENGSYFKELTDIAYENGKKYYAKIAVNNADKTYSLWLSANPITSSTAPVAEDSGFFCPDEASEVPFNLGFVVKKNVGNKTAGNMRVDNLVYTKDPDNNIKKETFDVLPTEGWAHRNSDGKQGSVTADGSLKIAYATKYARGGSMYSYYEDAELAAEEKFEVSYDFIPTLTAGKMWASFTLNGNGECADANVQNGPTGTETKLPSNYDSVQIGIINDKFVYGCSDESGNYYKEIPGVEYVSGKKYFLKVKVDSVAGTYTMWLSDAVITEETAPIVKDETFFLPSGTAPAKWVVSYYIQRLSSSVDAGSIVVDNLSFDRCVEAVSVIPTDFAIMNDDQQYMTTLGNSKYIDLINVPTDKEVIVAYYDADNKLVDVAVATGDTLRAIKSDKTAVSALVMTWDDFENIVPVNAAIELK